MSMIRERYQPGGDKYEAMRADLAWERAHEQVEEQEDGEDADE